MFRISQLIGQNSVDCNFFARDKKKIHDRPWTKKKPQPNPDSLGFYIHSLHKFVCTDFRIFSVFIVYLCQIWLRPYKPDQAHKCSFEAATSRPKIE